jgi:colanic acid/amylovoran biosynthesis glycosyltransferase
MRVLHFHHAWLPASEPFVWDLVRHLPGPGFVISDGELQNAERFPVPSVRSLAPMVRRIPQRRRQQVVTAGLVAYCLRHRIQVVHSHHGYEVVRVAGAARLLRLPLVVSLHGHDAFGWVERRPTAYEGILGQVAAVIVPSRFLASRAVELGARVDRVHVIGSGVDTRFFTPTPVPSRPEVLFVGRFVAKKGLDVLAAAWPSVVAAVPGARLRVLGYGPLEHVARSIGAEVERAPGRERVRAAIRGARVVVSPSRTATDDVAETLLMVNLEAQASGRPVVTTDHGGIPEYVIHDETALVVPENDSEALAAAIIRVLTEQGLAERLGAGGPALAANQDVQAVAHRVDRLYARLSR